MKGGVFIIRAYAHEFVGYVFVRGGPEVVRMGRLWQCRASLRLLSESVRRLGIVRYRLLGPHDVHGSDCSNPSRSRKG